MLAGAVVEVGGWGWDVVVVAVGVEVGAEAGRVGLLVGLGFVNGNGDLVVDGREALKACMSKPKEGTGRLA